MSKELERTVALVGTMNTSEKRYFKRYFVLHDIKRKDNFIKLFDFLETATNISLESVAKEDFYDENDLPVAQFIKRFHRLVVQSIAVNLEDKTSDGKEHPYITKLFDLTDLDEMHENTWKRIKQEQKMWREFAIKIAKDDGLIIDPIAYYDSDTQSAKLDTKFFGQTLQLLFEDFDVEKQKEDLFIIKLAAFELDMVKSSNDRERKTKLRKAKTPLEVLTILLEMKELSEIPV